MNEVAPSMKQTGMNMTALGIITVVLGVLTMLAPVFTGISILMLIGVLVAIAGLGRMFWAFQAASLGRGVLAFAVGSLTLLCGLALLANPLFASAILTIVLTVYLMLDGISEISLAFQLRPAAGWGYLLFGGVVSILLGVLIWRQFPLSGVWAIGIMLGIKLVVVGFLMLTIGSTARAAART